ncbi:MAG: hypothetical protein KDE27_26835, partial [Planctomycetes bacterium]|nr:hypothetical protein [Planctomycetota bacterium]
MRLRAFFVAALAGLVLSPFASAQAIPLPQNVDDSGFGPLLSGNVYLANQGLTVLSGRTLTVQPGVVVKFAAGTLCNVSGTLDVQATPAQPSYFTSDRDDTVGGVTNPLSPAPGDWRGVAFQPLADASTLRSLVVRFGGLNLEGGIELNAADILLDGVAVEQSATDGIDLKNSHAVLLNCRFDGNLGRAVENAPIAALDAFAGNTASGNLLGDAIRLGNTSVATNLTIGPGNLIGGVLVAPSLAVNGGVTLTLQAGVIVKFTAAGSLFNVAGNLQVTGTAQSPVVLTSLADDAVGGDTAKDGPTVGSPGDWRGLAFQPAADASVVRFATVRFAGQNLTGGIELNAADILLDGVAVERSASDGIDLQSSNAVLTGCRFDDNLGRGVDNVPIQALPNFATNTASGNTLGDAIRLGSSTVASNLTIGPANLIGDVLVAAAIGVIGGVTLTLQAGVVVKLTAPSSLFNVSGNLQVGGTATSPVVLTSIADDAIGGDTGKDGPTTGSPGDWRGLAFQPGATASAMRFLTVRFAGNGLSGGIEVNADVELTDSVVEQSLTRGLSVFGGNLPVVQRCRFDDNTTTAISPLSWDALSRFRDNTANGNQQGQLTRVSSSAVGALNRIDVWNTLNSDGVIAVATRTAIGGGRALILGPGLILKFVNQAAASSGFTATGTAVLAFDGRGYAPIVLTAFTDDQYGGDSNGDGNATVPAPGSWGFLEYTSFAGAAQCNHTLLRFGGLGAPATVLLDNGSVSIDAVRVELSSSNGFQIARNGGGCRNLVAFGNSGDGIVMSATNASLIHATVAANIGRGVVTQGTHTGAASACISWFNGINANDNYVGFVDNLGLPVRMFSCDGSPLHSGTQNNFVADPLFVDPNNGDLSLSLFSPCIGYAGAPNTAFTYEDHDGRSRVLDHNLFGFALPDIGAYEYGVYDATITGVPRLGSTVSFVVEGKPFQGNPPGAGILFFGGPFLGVGVFLP